MDVQELAKAYNGKAEKLSFGLRILQAKGPEGAGGWGTLIMHKHVSGVYRQRDDGEVEVLSLIAIPVIRNDLEAAYVAYTILINRLTGVDQKLCNKALKRMGLYKGKLPCQTKLGKYLLTATGGHGKVQLSIGS